MLVRKQAEDPNVVVDVTLPRSRRPMIGLDIEEWRAELALSKFEAQHALGFRNSNHYNKICSRDLLPFELASVLLLMAMIGAIVLARRDVLASDVITGEPADQGLIEKARTPLLVDRAKSASTP